MPEPQSSAPPRLVFHLGDFKTGTTVLQHWLAQGDGPFMVPPGVPHVDLVHSLNRPPAQPDTFAPVVEMLRAAPPGRTVVVSAEHFEFADPARLKEAIARHLAPWRDQIGLIAYVRPHLPALLSRYSESTKIGSFDGTLRAFLDWPQTVRRMTYAPRFARWRETFGGAFSLRLHDRDRLTGGDIRRDFTQVVTGRDPGEVSGGMSGPAGSANDQLGVRHLALARALHRAIRRALMQTTGPVAPGSSAEAAQWTLGRHLGRMLAGGPVDTGPPLRADTLLAEAVAARFGADAAALDAAFFAPRENGSDTAQTGPVAAHLAQARAQAPATAPQPDPETLLSDETRATLILWGTMLAHPLSHPQDAEALGALFHETHIQE